MIRRRALVVMGAALTVVWPAAGRTADDGSDSSDSSDPSDSSDSGDSLWGFALGLYPVEAAARGWSYPPEPSEVAALGASGILLTPSWSQETVRSDRIEPDDDTPSDDDLRVVMERARRLGMSVTLMPYLRVRAGGPGAWRGTIAPEDEDAWWSSYAAFVLHYARVAHAADVRLFAIGSELTSLSTEADASRWSELALRVRRTTRARLAFVANHDALDRLSPFEFVDVAGVSAYFPCEEDPARDWRRHVTTLRAFANEVHKPLVLFELGFPSRRGSLARPWDHVAGTPVDVDAQAAGYAAATEALRGEDWLAGLFFWAWYGDGGRYDRGYSPRGKPAQAIAEGFLRSRLTAAQSLE